jgi:hypothetical protein
MRFGGESVDVVDRARFITHVMLYWLTATAGSSAREYYEDARTGAGYRDEPNTVPTGLAVFKNDFHTIRRFAERANNIVHRSVFDRGWTLRGYGRAGPPDRRPAKVLPPASIASGEVDGERT